MAQQSGAIWYTFSAFSIGGLSDFISFPEISSQHQISGKITTTNYSLPNGQQKITANDYPRLNNQWLETWKVVLRFRLAVTKASIAFPEISLQY